MSGANVPLLFRRNDTTMAEIIQSNCREYQWSMCRLVHFTFCEYFIVDEEERQSEKESFGEKF